MKRFYTKLKHTFTALRCVLYISRSWYYSTAAATKTRVYHVYVVHLYVYLGSIILVNYRALRYSLLVSNSEYVPW